MRPRLSRGALGLGAALLVAVILGIALVPDLRADPPGASPATLKRIGQKNERAAMEAAAQMRAESRASAAAADSRLAAEERGRAKADAALARFESDEAGRRDLAPADARQ